MPYLLELAIILMFCLAGNFISSWWLPFIPGNILSMLLLFFFLAFRLLKIERIQNIAWFLLRNMPFFFIAVTTGIVETYAIVSSQILDLLLIAVISTIITLAVTGWTTQFIVGLQAKRRIKRGNSI